jgi:hypothetical protein
MLIHPNVLSLDEVAPQKMRFHEKFKAVEIISIPGQPFRSDNPVIDTKVSDIWSNEDNARA